MEPASHFEVTDYLAKQSRSLSGELDDPKIAPTKAAVEFLVTDTGQIDLATDSPKTSDPEVQSVLYEEIKSEVKQILTLGQNVLGEHYESIDSFAKELPENVENSSITKIWTRTNRLRSILLAHDKAENKTDYSYARIELVFAEKLRSLLRLLSAFIAGDEKGQKLDEVSIGPIDTKNIKDTLQDFKQITDEFKSVLSDRACVALNEQLANVENAGDDIHSKQGLKVAASSFSNLVAVPLRLFRAWAEDKVATVFNIAMTAASVAAINFVMQALEPVKKMSIANYPLFQRLLTELQRHDLLELLKQFLS